MPSATEFRVGDRVETRRGSRIPPNYRQLRAEVVQIMSNGTIKVRFVNPPVFRLGEHVHYNTNGDRWWRPDELRLIERALRLEVGARVRISDPAYANTSSGYVSSSFFGAEGTVMAPAGRGAWDVQLPSGSMNSIHHNFLTVIGEPVPSRFHAEDWVQIAPSAYWTPTALSSARCHSRIQDQLVRLSSLAGSQVWEVVTADRTYSGRVHENWMTPYMDEADPLFEVGQVVTVGHGPRSLTPGIGVIGSGWAAARGLIVAMETPTRPRVRMIPNGPSGLGGAEQVIHQSHLTRVEVVTPPVGTHVMVLKGAVGQVGGTGQATPLTSRVIGRMGVARETRAEGVVVVTMDYDHSNHYVHPAYLQSYTPEETALMLSPGDMVRVSTDAFDDAVDRRVLGLVCRVEGLTGGVMWQVTDHAFSGCTQSVHRRHLTKIVPVSTVETGHIRCGTCGEQERLETSAYIHGVNYCNQCVAECAICHTTYRLNASGLIWNGRWECTDCVGQCASCNVRQPRAEMAEDRGYFYCSDHHNICAEDDCDALVFGGHTSCPSCRRDGVGRDALGGWRRTNATMWLGGPVKEDGGYYIGFEHEVMASGDFRIKPLRKWAKENLGSSIALDPKPDSSVRGFEIATQPMTPEFFENVDWDSYMDVINSAYPLPSDRNGKERKEHGLHVHIGRQAFRRVRVMKKDSRGRPLKKPRKVMVTDASMLAAFTYLLSRGHQHLERIGRRAGSEWSPQVTKPVKAAIMHEYSDIQQYGKQREKLRNESITIPRGAVNLTNSKTVEIRTARSTRSAQDLKDAVRVVYLAAEYIRSLRAKGSINPKGVNWAAFALWVGEVMPDAYPSIAGTTESSPVPVTVMSETLFDAFRTPEAAERKEGGGVNVVNQVIPEAITETQDDAEDDPADESRSFTTTMSDSMTATLRATVRGPQLVEQRFAVGARVRVSDPAYTRADGQGGVSPSFYGQECRVTRLGATPGTYRVQMHDPLVGVVTNTIHQNYLTLTMVETHAEVSDDLTF